MVDSIGTSPSPLPVPVPTLRPNSASFGGSSIFDQYRNDATELLNGALDDALLPSGQEIGRLVGSARDEVFLRGNAADLLEARARELVANSAPAQQVEGAFGNLRLEQIDLSAAETRLADLSETSLRRSTFDAAGDLLGGMLAVDELLSADREVKRLAEVDPRAAWRKTLSTSLGVFVDFFSPVSKLGGGGLKSAIGDVGFGAAAKSLGERLADATFDPIHRLARKLAEQPWWPKNRQPRV